MSEGDWIEDEKTTDSGEAMFSEVFGEGGFDTSKVKSNLLPAGVYRMRISKAETRASKAGPNMLALTLTVAEPSDYEGKRHYENLNLQHASAQVREIAKQQLKAICLACGITQARSPSDLIDRECVATIAIMPASCETTSKNGTTPARNCRRCSWKRLAVMVAMRLGCDCVMRRRGQ